MLRSSSASYLNRSDQMGGERKRGNEKEREECYQVVRDALRVGWGGSGGEWAAGRWGTGQRSTMTERQQCQNHTSDYLMYARFWAEEPLPHNRAQARTRRLGASAPSTRGQQTTLVLVCSRPLVRAPEKNSIDVNFGGCATRNAECTDSDPNVAPGQHSNMRRLGYMGVHLSFRGLRFSATPSLPRVATGTAFVLLFGIGIGTATKRLVSCANKNQFDT